MNVVFIAYPYAFTADGKRVDIRHIEGTVRVGANLQESDGKFKVICNTMDSDCVSGQCPVR